jgi:hypothetical protein
MHVDLLFPSKYIKAADLMDKPEGAPLTISRIEKETLKMQDGSEEEKWVVHFDEWSSQPEDKRKRLVLNKTNAISIATVHGNETDEWKGKKITLYATTCMAFGSRQDCIRIQTADR